MLPGAVRISCVPTTRATQRTMPIQHSQTPSWTHARNESGGIVSARRLQGLSSGHLRSATVYLHLLRGSLRLAVAPGSSSVITLLGPRFPQGGGVPAPTRIV